MISRDRADLVLVAVGILSLLFASIVPLHDFFGVGGPVQFPPFIRYTAYTLLIVAVSGIVLLVAVFIVLLVLFYRGVAGPKSLSGTRCLKCGKRQAIEEISRTFLHGNVKVDFDHYNVLYCCSECGQQQEQEEHVFSKKQDHRAVDGDAEGV